MANNEKNILKLIENGCILECVSGTNTQEVFSEICKNVPLPNYIDKNDFFAQICEREKSISTAIGKGIAIPHPCQNMLKSIDDQRIFLCFLENAIDMKAFDGEKVSMMFVILSYSQEEHLKILQKLAMLLQNKNFKDFLETKPKLESLREFLDSV